MRPSGEADRQRGVTRVRSLPSSLLRASGSSEVLLQWPRWVARVVTSARASPRALRIFLAEVCAPRPVVGDEWLLHIQ